MVIFQFWPSRLYLGTNPWDFALQNAFHYYTETFTLSLISSNRFWKSGHWMAKIKILPLKIDRLVYHCISQNPVFLSFLESSWDFNFIFLKMTFFSFLTQRTIFILRFNSMTICELGGMTLLTVTLTMNTTVKMSDSNWSEIKFASWSRGNDVIIIFGAKKWPALHSLLKNAQFRAQIRLTSIY